MKRAICHCIVGLCSLTVELSSAPWSPQLPAEKVMADLIAGHAEQGRANMVHHELLNFLARRKALDMVERQYWGHVDPDGYAANYIAQLAGYPLSYGSSHSLNSIESIGARHQNNLAASSAASMVFQAWLDSPAHRAHVLGELGYYAAQTYYGVGYAYAPTGPYGYSSHYFVFTSAPPQPQAALTPYVLWQFEKMTVPQLDHPDQDPDQDKIPNLLEYVVNSNPVVAEAWPIPPLVYDRQQQRAGLTVPIRADLDPTVIVAVETTLKVYPAQWTTAGVDRVGHTFWAGQIGDAQRFMRLTIRR